jgi:hypothetical protein
MMSGKNLNLNSNTMSISKGSSFKATEAILFNIKQELSCDHGSISAPLIFISRPEVVKNDGCAIEGKVLYHSDPKTCAEYGENSLISDICHSLHDHDGL